MSKRVIVVDVDDGSAAEQRFHRFRKAHRRLGVRKRGRRSLDQGLTWRWTLEVPHAYVPELLALHDGDTCIVQLAGDS